MGAMISRKTLIANGYHQDIFARVENDKSSAVKCGATHLRVPTYSSSNNNNNFRCDADGKRQQEKKLQDDDDDDEFTTHELFKEKLFTKIGPGFRACFRTARNANDSHHHQQQQQSGGETALVVEEVYISIALANGDFICRGLPVSCRRNGCIIIIVDGKGNLKTGQPHSTIVTAAGSTKSKAAWKDFVVADDDDNMKNKIKKNI
uniref:Uncharacterized protein n=1 Tax=Daphnia galeata TaxID=27404 RepID=A0A8J2RP07_9CRUS|nr:unnamed protein product [Daphnia galeata]